MYSKIINKSLDQSTIILLNRPDKFGFPYYFYLKIKEDKLKQINQEHLNKEVDVEQYGEVLHSGPGLYPPYDVRQAMLEDFGFDTDSMFTLNEFNELVN